MSNNLKSSSQSTGGPKFANKNLNASFTSTISTRTPVNNRSQIVYSGTKRLGKPVGAAAAPTPLNTPSLRRENNGKDVSVPLVPAGAGGVWGISGNDSKVSVPQTTADVSNAPPSVVAKPAPWAKPASAEVIEAANEVKPKPGSTPHKSWADAESDEEEDDEDDEPVTPVGRRMDFPPSTGQPQHQQQHQYNPVVTSNNTSLNQNRIYQRDTVVQHQQSAQPYNLNQSSRPSFGNSNSNSISNNYNSGNHIDNQIESTRFELQQLELRKKQQEQQQFLSQRGPSSHFSGSGLLNSDNTVSSNNNNFSRGGDDSKWERGAKKVEPLPSSVDNQFQPRVLRSSSAGVVGPPQRSVGTFNQQQQQSHPHSNQYPQLNRVRGPSEDLSIIESGAPHGSAAASVSHVSSGRPLYKLNSEVESSRTSGGETFDMKSLERRPNGTANAAAATVVEANKSFASLLRHGDAPPAPSVSAVNGITTSPASKKKMLFDPKSSQFVDSTQEEKWSRAPRRAPTTGVVEATNNEVQVASTKEGSKFTPTLLTRPHQSGEQQFKRGSVPVSPKAGDGSDYVSTFVPDMDTIAKAEHDKAERQKEKQSRGPRTKGLLFRHTESGEIERVLSELEEAVQEASKQRAKQDRKALGESVGVVGDDDSDNEQDKRRGGKPSKVKKERKPLSKKNANYDVFPDASEIASTGASTAAALNVDEIQKIASGSDALNLSFIPGLGVGTQEDERRESKLASWSSPSRTEGTATRMHWAQSGGLQMLQPQQNPDAELDHSLSLNLDGILSSSSMLNSTSDPSWTYFQSDFSGSSFPTFGGLSGTNATNGGSLLDASSSLAISDSIASNGDEHSKPVERVKRGSKYDKGSVAHRERTTERPPRQYKSPKPARGGEITEKSFKIDDSGVGNALTKERPVRKERLERPDKPERLERGERVPHTASTRPPRTTAPKRERPVVAKHESRTTDK